MKLIKTLAILLIVVAVFGGAMYALNLHTGPIIESNKLGAIKDRLNQVMPDATSYEEVTDQLTNVPANVTAVYKETAGKGYVVLCNAESKYSSAPMEITVGVAADGKICGVVVDSYNDTADYDFRSKDPNYLASYVGKDSALADIGTVSGSTFSSTAFKNAVSEAMGVLIENNLIKAGEKTPEQILTELIATVYPEMAPEGVLKAEKIDATGNITVAYKSTNDTGYAHIIKKGEASYLVIVNANDESKVYDIEGKDVTADNADLAEEAKAHIEISKLSALLAVMPEGATLNGESLIYDFENATASALKNVPASVTYIYKEANGLGYIICTTATSQFSEAPMQITVGVGSDGKICGIRLDSYSDSIDFRVKDDKYMISFIGKDSALADIGTVSGATFSSTAFKNAVSEAMGVLIENDMIAAGVKSDEQILTELVATVAPGYTKTEEMTASGNIKKALKATNDTGFAYIMTEGENSYLAVVNAMGVCKIYDVEGTEVTADCEALVTEAKAHAAANQPNYLDSFKAKIERMMVGATDITSIDLDTFNTVVSAVSFTVDGKNYYGFYSRSIGFHQMDVYVVIDENGAIAKIDAKQFIFDEEYFMNFGGMDVPAYKEGFIGITGDTWTGDAAIIATATMTSNAMKESTADAFASFDSIQKGGVQ